MHSGFRSILAAFGLLLICSFTGAPAPPATTTYQFTGTCETCTGNAIGTLVVLQTYTPGGPFLAPYFVSYTFSSNLGNFSISSGANVNGRLQGSMPSAASVSIGDGTNVFQSNLNGQWCIGPAPSCALDPTSSGTWGPPTAPIFSAAPAPALNDWMLAGLAAALAVMGSILVKKIQARKAA
jgi:hypothetical protein